MSHFFSTLFLLDIVGSTLVWAMFRVGVPFLAPVWTLGIFWLLSALFIFANTWLHLLPPKLTRLLAWVSGVWMGFLYYGFLFLLPFFLVLMVSVLGHFPELPGAAARVLFVADEAVIVYGFVRALTPAVREVTVKTDKISRPCTLAFASDIHFGGLFGIRHARKLVQAINKQHPDAVLFGGDIVDGDFLFVQQEKTLDELKKIQAPGGMFAVYGNHDKRLGTGPLEKQLLEQEGIRFLVDAQCAMTPEITLTGMDDYLFGERKTEIPPAAGKFNIYMEHEPQRVEKAAEAGYDLYFAGHTHAGQMFPNRLVTRKLFALDYGTKPFGTMTAIVSSGWGLWGIPVRTGPRSELVVVKILPRPL